MSGEVVSVLFSHDDGEWFESDSRRPGHLAAEMGAWLLLDVMKGRQPEGILTT